MRYAESATLLRPATLAAYIIDQNSTITLRLILITLHVDFGVVAVVVGQDTHNSNISIASSYS